MINSTPLVPHCSDLSDVIALLSQPSNSSTTVSLAIPCSRSEEDKRGHAEDLYQAANLAELEDHHYEMHVQHSKHFHSSRYRKLKTLSIAG